MDKILSFGATQSIKDYRTITADVVRPTLGILPSTGKVPLVINYVNDLSNQMKLGICTMCAVRMAAEEHFKDGIRLSEYWGYLIGKIYGDGNLYEGSSALTMLKSADINHHGIPTKDMETKFPLKVNGTYAEFIQDFFNKYGGNIPQEILDNARAHRISGYYSVPVTPISIATEISGGRLVVIRLAVGENFYTAPDGTVSWLASDLLPLRAPITVVSGHLLAMNEYVGLGNNQIDKGPNSWSKLWADNGYYNFIFNVQYPYYFTEAWAISDIPPVLIQIVKDLPDAKNFNHHFTTWIERGQISPEVRMLQIALSIMDFLNISITELGNYGPKTAAGVLKYQKARKLLPTATLDDNKGNYVHQLTIDSLNKDMGV